MSIPGCCCLLVLVFGFSYFLASFLDLVPPCSLALDSDRHSHRLQLPGRRHKHKQADGPRAPLSNGVSYTYTTKRIALHLCIMMTESFIHDNKEFFSDLYNDFGFCVTSLVGTQSAFK